MKTTIYYFTGTGNSLQVAKELTDILSDTTLVRISNNININTSSDVIGLVFPVYLWGVPEIVKNFLDNNLSEFDSKYIFAVATYKSQAGNVFGQLQKILKPSGNKISAGFTVEMPGNNIIYYDVESEDILKEKEQKLQAKIRKICTIINNQQTCITNTKEFKETCFTEFLHNTLTKSFNRSDKNFWVTENCTHCGICEKICPVNNISITDGKPVWNHSCLQCVGCINACPNSAIQYGKTTINKKRYINKSIGLNELLLHK